VIKIILAAAIAVTAVAPPAAAQYYGGGGYYGDGYRRSYRDYDEPPRRRYREERYDNRYDRRDFNDGYDRRGDDRRGDNRGRGFQQPVPGPGRGGGGFANTCVTPRGPCQSPPQPAGSGCICFVPGVGNTPGTMR
jgi:hypothetical protein